jgi:hypothetical protein
MRAAGVATRLPVPTRRDVEQCGNQVATQTSSLNPKLETDPWQPGCQCKGEHQ